MMLDRALKRRLDAIDQQLAAIASQVAAVLKQGKKLMGLAQDMKDLLTAIDKASTDAAARWAALLASLKNTMTDAELADIKAQGQAEIDFLNGLGKDPVAPVPPLPPVPPPPAP